MAKKYISFVLCNGGAAGVGALSHVAMLVSLTMLAATAFQIAERFNDATQVVIESAAVGR